MAISLSEHFPAKWMPVRVEKMQQSNDALNAHHAQFRMSIVCCENQEPTFFARCAFLSEHRLPVPAFSRDALF
jgi:hypothetical protein